jgi:hypothetical protein
MAVPDTFILPNLGRLGNWDITVILSGKDAQSGHWDIFKLLSVTKRCPHVRWKFELMNHRAIVGHHARIGQCPSSDAVLCQIFNRITEPLPFGGRHLLSLGKTGKFTKLTLHCRGSMSASGHLYRFQWLWRMVLWNDVGRLDLYDLAFLYEYCQYFHKISRIDGNDCPTCDRISTWHDIQFENAIGEVQSLHKWKIGLV